MDWMQWITLVEIPALVALYMLVQRCRSAGDAAITEVWKEMDRMKEQAATSKLEAERRFASIEYLKDVDKRLSTQLLRIEGKLDAIQHSRGGD